MRRSRPRPPCPGLGGASQHTCQHRHLLPREMYKQKVTAGYKGISGNWEAVLEASPARAPGLSATGIFIESFQLVFKKDTHGFGYNILDTYTDQGLRFILSCGNPTV